MSRLFERAGAVLFLATSATLIAPACVDNESSLFIRQVLVTPSKTCSVKADITSETLGEGFLDGSFGVPYTAALLVGNQLVRRGDPDRLKTETSRIRIESADVSVLDASGAVLSRADGSTAEFNTPATGFIDPGSGSTPGYGLAFVELIDATLAANLGSAAQGSGVVQQVVASVILRGRTLGGTEIASGEFQFPIKVCFGCLCDKASCCATTTCQDPAAMFDKNCHPGFDAVTDCRQGSSACQCLATCP